MIHKVSKNPFKTFCLWLVRWAETPFEREKREHEEACGRFVSGCVGIICTNSEPKCTRSAPQCGAEHPNNRAVFCTRKKDHEGPHIHCWSGWEPYIHNMHTWV